MRKQIIFGTTLLAILLSACGKPVDTHAGQPVTHRREAFRKILKAFEPMGVQLRKSQYDATQFISLAKALSDQKNGPWQYFGDDTNYPPTKAKPRVWSSAGEFDANRLVFIESVNRLVKASETRDEKSVRAAYDAVYETCRTCHKAFKE